MKLYDVILKSLLLFKQERKEERREREKEKDKEVKKEIKKEVREESPSIQPLQKLKIKFGGSSSSPSSFSISTSQTAASPKPETSSPAQRLEIPKLYVITYPVEASGLNCMIYNVSVGIYLFHVYFVNIIVIMYTFLVND